MSGGNSLDTLIKEAREAEREGLWSVARQGYESALQQLADRDDAPLASTLLRWIGRTYMDGGGLLEADDCFEAAMAVAELAEDLEAQAHAMNCMAITRQKRGELDEAVELYLAARVLAAEAGEVKLLAMVEQNLGTIANIRGDLDKALRHYEAALKGYRQLGLQAYLGPLLNNLAMLRTHLGEYDEAEVLYVEAFENAQSEGAVNAQVAIQVNRVDLWIAQEDWPRARETCDRAYGLAQRLGASRWLGEIHKHYGVIARELGDLTSAVDGLLRAERLAQEANDTLLRAETLKELAQVYWQEGRHRDTLGCLDRAYRLFNELRARRDLADVDRQMNQLEDFFLEIVQRWGESIESKDRYTHGHCERVAELSCALARATGIDEGVLIWFRMGAFLHDVGKVVVPWEILNKPGSLTEDERAVMQCHSEEGERLLADIEFPWDIRPMVRHHHEHWAGTGYPDGLSAFEVPLAARILCIADVYDALTTQRSYRDPYTSARALEIMREDAGRIFDPHLLKLFENLVWFGKEKEEIMEPETSFDVEVREEVTAFPWSGLGRIYGTSRTRPPPPPRKRRSFPRPHPGRRPGLSGAIPSQLNPSAPH